MGSVLTELVIIGIVERIDLCLTIRHGMEKIARADAAAVLTVARPHERLPSVFGPDFVHSLAGRRASFLAGGHGKRLDLLAVAAGAVLTLSLSIVLLLGSPNPS